MEHTHFRPFFHQPQGMNPSKEMSGDDTNNTGTIPVCDRNGTCNETKKAKMKSPPVDIPLRIAAIKEYEEDDGVESDAEESSSLPPSDTETLCGDDDINDDRDKQKESPADEKTTNTLNNGNNSETTSPAA